MTDGCPVEGNRSGAGGNNVLSVQFIGGEKISGELAAALMLSECTVSQYPRVEMVFDCIAAGHTLAGIHFVPALTESRSG